MYLKKITGIKNIGKFRSGGVSGGEYGKYTLIYGLNGRGKTTVCAVLRSLQRNDPNLIIERLTFGSQANPEAQLLLDSGVVRFSNGVWSHDVPNIHIFDNHFIAENIHGGEEISTEHRRNLYRIVIGPNGVKLAQEIDELDTKATAKQGEIATEKKALQQHVPKFSTLEKFIGLDAIDSIDDKITLARISLKAAKNSNEINTRKLISTVSLPKLPDEFEAILTQTITEITAEATALVQEQLIKHGFQDGGKEWLNTGVKHIAGSDCPFCGNSLVGNNLIEAYKGYFGAAYAAFYQQIISLRKLIVNSLSEATGLRIRQAYKDIESEVEFWRSFADLNFESPAVVEKIESYLAALLEATLALIDLKIASPLDPIPLTDSFKTALQDWTDAVNKLESSEQDILKINLEIQTIKDKNTLKDQITIEREIQQMEAVKLRYSDSVDQLARNYQKLIKEKETIVAEKDAKKLELDTYDKQILVDYEVKINNYLKLFGASFRISNTEKNYIGKIPQSVFHIQFGNHSVDISTEEEGKPTFRSTMSAGDKSTLALAFFLAQIDEDKAISEKLVVFDDPFTSLDDFRREVTAKCIFRVGKIASQVIVFSHDKYFLDAVRNKIPNGDLKAFQISCTQNNSVFEQWDIEREVKEGYLQDHMALLEYSSGTTGDSKAMRTLMRPLLEKYIRYRFPNQIEDGKWLGDMLKVVRENPNHPLQAVYKELDDINEFTAPFHHDPNTTFNPDEVRTFVERTLAVVGGC